MTAKILQFKGASGFPHHRSSDLSIKVSDSRLFEDAQEDILGQWRDQALRNGLDRFFHGCLPQSLKKKRFSPYLEDINYLCHIERQLDICTMIFSPGATLNNKHGWVAAFKIDKYAFNTPEMVSEGAARGVNILCYLAFSEEKKKHPQSRS